MRPMTHAAIAAVAGRTAATALAVLTLAACHGENDADRPSAAETHPSLLYGRVTMTDGATYDGRLRFGGDEEAFWGDYFNGAKDENPWVAHVPPDRLPMERRALDILGVEIAHRESRIDLRRPFMARFGDIARLEARGRDLRVTLKSGTEFHLDRFGADDYADGVRVWDGRNGAVDLDEWKIRSIDFLSPPRPGTAAPSRLHGTVRTRQGGFTGFLQWDREEGVGLDELDGHTDDGELRSLPFRTIRSIVRRSRGSSLVTLRDGREVVLTGTREVGEGNRGVYVDDPRYGRVLISWDAFERVDFSPDGGRSGPSYGDFPPGGPITGRVTTRAGVHPAGRLVYDLDESEFTETLDAPSGGVDYTIPFGLVASIVLAGSDGPASGRARVRLHGGEELRLERDGDLGDGNAGILIFRDGREPPEYVSWRDIERIDFDRPPVMYPPVGGEPRLLDAARTPNGEG